MRVVSFLGVVATVLIGCGPDLGQCEPGAAKTVVYSPQGTPYYAGQAIIQQSCTGCHGSGSTEAVRKGAPHGLNFNVGGLSAMSTPADVASARESLSKIKDEADEMYGQIESGNMPPPSPAGDSSAQVWKFADGSDANLPDVRSDVGKSTVRNWLSCGAPVVAGATGAVADASTIGDVLPPGKATAVEATFDSVFTGVLSAGCGGCHNTASAMAGLDLSTPAIAYAALVNKDASASSACAGKGKLVVPGNCESSVLYSKLLPAPVCGSTMPLGMPALGDAQRSGLCDWIKAGAKQ
jgi:uncharacterized membrane protein